MQLDLVALVQEAEHADSQARLADYLHDMTSTNRSLPMSAEALKALLTIIAYWGPEAETWHIEAGDACDEGEEPDEVLWPAFQTLLQWLEGNDVPVPFYVGD